MKSCERHSCQSAKGTEYMFMAHLWWHNKGRPCTYPGLHEKEHVVRLCRYVVNKIFSTLNWKDPEQNFVIFYLYQIRVPIVFSLRQVSSFTHLKQQAVYPRQMSAIIFRLWHCLLLTSRPSSSYRGYIYIYIYIYMCVCVCVCVCVCEMLGQISSVSYKLK